MLQIVHKMSFGLMCSEQYDLKHDYLYTFSVKYLNMLGPDNCHCVRYSCRDQQWLNFIHCE